jgi:hypothetical protein
MDCRRQSTNEVRPHQRKGWIKSQDKARLFFWKNIVYKDTNPDVSAFIFRETGPVQQFHK